MKEKYGVDSMPETAENVATDFRLNGSAGSHGAGLAIEGGRSAESGFFNGEITPVTIPQKKGDAIVVDKDEHPRDTSLEALAKLKGVVRPDGTVTAGNASGVNDGSCAILMARSCSENHNLAPRAVWWRWRWPAYHRASWASARHRRHEEGAGTGRPAH